MPVWDSLARQSIDFAASAAELGFAAARGGTRVGFSITRGIANTAAGVTSTVVDHALFGGSTVVRPVIGGAVSTILSLAEQVTMAPISFGEYITSTSLLAAHSSINVLSLIFPGDETSFSLASFITLVKREWNDPVDGEHLPSKRFGITQIARAVVAWVALQGVTQGWQEEQWFKSLREIHVKEAKRFDSLVSRRGSRIRVTSDVIFPGNRGQIISADIGEAPPSRAQSVIRANTLGRSSFGHRRLPTMAEPFLLSNSELKATLRRLSKMVLAGYGGASLLFFGVSPIMTDPNGNAASTSLGGQKSAEEANLANAIDASEAEAAGDCLPPDSASSSGNAPYSWWDILLGKHDHQIFEHFANHGVPSGKANANWKADLRATAVIGAEHQMPRFWVLTDHIRQQIVLVLRGTMSLNEIAVDLTCDPATFEPAITPPEGSEEPVPPGHFTFPSVEIPAAPSGDHTIYHAHGGMLRMAKTMGAIGKPVQLAVHEALYKNPDYDLVLCGHSLGAGVAAILGLMWADPKTCLTVPSSGLPIRRHVSVYCFAPPCVVDATLSKLASKLIVSFVYSHDVVSRLSLGSVKDLKNAASWLCDSNDADTGAGYTAVTNRAKEWKAGQGSPDDPYWFIAMRKTLQANMQNANMFPPGRVLWAMRDSDMHPSHRVPKSTSEGSSTPGADRLRLFEVLDVEKIFHQIVFAKDMLSAHMPHTYDRVLHDLL